MLITSDARDHDLDPPTHRRRLFVGVALVNEAGGDIVDTVRQLDRAGVDLVVIDDSFDHRPTAGAGERRLDALLLAACIAPLTERIGLVPTVTVTHTEPFHISKNIATLDWVSQGRAGWRVDVSRTSAEAVLFGRKAAAPADVLAREADDAVEVVRRLWDSWEDGAVIRDAPTGRYIDRDLLHYIDFEGEFFSVRGPSITPRSPQGQPLVMVDALDAPSSRFAACRADLVVVDGSGPVQIDVSTRAMRDAVETAGRRADDVRVLARVNVAGADGETAALVERLAAIAGSTSVDGVLLEGAHVQAGPDLVAFGLLPALRAAGLAYEPSQPTSLRARLGFGRPLSRYTAGATR